MAKEEPYTADVNDAVAMEISMGTDRTTIWPSYTSCGGPLSHDDASRLQVRETTGRGGQLQNDKPEDTCLL